MAEYIEREYVLDRIDGIWDCADMGFEPEDHCCSADDCAHCKWRETKNAIRKIIASIPSADVQPVAHGEWLPNKYVYDALDCSICGHFVYAENISNFCPSLRREDGQGGLTMADYIDRDAFIAEKRMHYCAACNRRQGMKNGKMQFCYEIGDAPCRACDVADILNCIEDFPAADVRPVVRGRWIEKGGVWECPECKAAYKARLLYIKPNFCPNCGTDMRETCDSDSCQINFKED